MTKKVIAPTPKRPLYPIPITKEDYPQQASTLAPDQSYQNSTSVTITGSGFGDLIVFPGQWLALNYIKIECGTEEILICDEERQIVYCPGYRVFEFTIPCYFYGKIRLYRFASVGHIDIWVDVVGRMKPLGFVP